MGQNGGDYMHPLMKDGASKMQICQPVKNLVPLNMLEMYKVCVAEWEHLVYKKYLRKKFPESQIEPSGSVSCPEEKWCLSSVSVLRV